MANHNRIWEGERYVVSKFTDVLGDADSFKIWDKQREVHRHTYRYYNEDMRLDAKEQAVAKAKDLDAEYRTTLEGQHND